MKKYPVWLMAVALCFSSLCNAQQSKQNQKEYKTYQKISDLGSELFWGYLKENGGAIRTTIILKACNKDGLVKAVSAKKTDPNFVDRIQSFMLQGKFTGLPSYALGDAQSVANGMATGYDAGFMEAIHLIMQQPNEKTLLCAVGVNTANKLLK